MIRVQMRHDFAGFSTDLDFQAPPGVTVLFGPSGSGKSTVLNAVAGLLRPDRARISVDGAVLTDTGAGVFTPPHRRRLGVIFQDGRLFPHLTVQQNLRYGRWFSRRSGPDEGAVIEMLGIAPLLARRPATLSGGERQRVAIGRALLAGPRLILADEPLSALDQSRKAEIMPYLERLRDEWHVPMLYVSHSASEVARLATTVVMLDQGRVARIGPAAEVLADPAGAGNDPGAVVLARVVAHHPDGVTELRAGDQALFLPLLEAWPGDHLRLRIVARDVMLAQTVPQGISALNILPGVVEALHNDGPVVMVRLMTAAGPVLSRITQRSARQLEVRPGKPLVAIVKSLSHSPADIGRAAQEKGNTNEIERTQSDRGEYHCD
ncbi:MAG: molybdenum ABC transporter ATP-binding protein [Paracoccus sp. (in: a-proteobacteria)]|uniref:molybdenum ABC transporter ATP-binding protein n=1 Tax=Paracoccus sp. TaxID=267 RepID=UPI0026E0C361|nr:molybdenum ABC transporter ATP-binding protein [Paracoccus sp. (in: a-proteobacteria)]MDO5620388.1 molybdenum ABC transporter ATP-binding protein [Paracoccus sp. (in: a-proteobacteria)]